jgi:hypothetical protein
MRGFMTLILLATLDLMTIRHCIYEERDKPVL